MVVEAVLTKKGREKIANGQPLGITKFALADDEIDYRLFNPNHPSGSEFAGDTLLNMPLMEAFVDETQVMRYKLVTLPKNTPRMPVVTVPSEQFTLESTTGAPATITPTTQNGSDATLGYTAILHDAEIATISVTPAGSISTTTGTIPVFLSDADSTRTQTVIGTEFVIHPNQLSSGTYNTKVTIIGNQTGGSTTINLTIKSSTTQ